MYILLFWNHGKRRNTLHAYYYIISKRLRYVESYIRLRASLMAVLTSDRVQCFPSILCLPGRSGRIPWRLRLSSVPVDMAGYLLIRLIYYITVSSKVWRLFIIAVGWIDEMYSYNIVSIHRKTIIVLRSKSHCTIKTKQNKINDRKCWKVKFKKGGWYVVEIECRSSLSSYFKRTRLSLNLIK